ncbi:hypothetical protein T492DRAFT_867921 [Pavlovales sp. CCMP2436]|nr:hypothetical protein T492DRAFT_867921 [Pavlovales sp. CCMP2436]
MAESILQYRRWALLALLCLLGAAGAREQGDPVTPAAHVPRPRAPALGAGGRAGLVPGEKWRLISIRGFQNEGSPADELLSAGEMQARLLRRWQLITLICLACCYVLGIGSAAPALRKVGAQVLQECFKERGVEDAREAARARMEVVGNQAYACGLVLSIPLLGALGPKNCLAITYVF